MGVKNKSEKNWFCSKRGSCTKLASPSALNEVMDLGLGVGRRNNYTVY